MSRTVARFGAWTRLRLWLSYQRYAFLLVAAAAAIVGAIWLLAPGAWYLWALAALPVARILAFAVEVYRRFPKKMRATAIASRRIAQHRFHAKSVSGYCGDPCFRVVAREILRRADIDRAERRRLIRQYTSEARQPAFVIVVDADSANPVQVRGSLVADQGAAGPLTTESTDVV